MTGHVHSPDVRIWTDPVMGWTHAERDAAGRARYHATLTLGATTVSCRHLHRSPHTAIDCAEGRFQGKSGGKEPGNVR